MDKDRINVRPIGLSYHGEGIPADKVDRHWMQIGQAATLKDLSAEYAWFSLALMYSRVPLMGRDPWADYVAESGHDETFQVTIKFDRPIFRGLEIGTNREYNHVLWAIERERWDDYCKWMGRVSFVDRDQQTAVRLRTQTLSIADPLYFDKVVIMPVNCPMVEITAFVLDASYGCVYMQPSEEHPLLDLPRVVTHVVPFADTKIWATAVLNNHPDPFGLVERVLEVDPVQELAERVKQAREQDEN